MGRAEVEEMKITIDLEEFNAKTAIQWAIDRNMSLEEYCSMHLNQSIDEVRPR